MKEDWKEFRNNEIKMYPVKYIQLREKSEIPKKRGHIVIMICPLLNPVKSEEF